MRQFQLLPGKLYSFQSIFNRNISVIGIYISGPELKYSGVLFGKSKVLVGTKTIEVDLSLYNMELMG